MGRMKYTHKIPCTIFSSLSSYLSLSPLSFSETARKWLNQLVSKQMTAWKLKGKKKKNLNSTHMTPAVFLLLLFIHETWMLLYFAKRKNPAEVILNYCMLGSDRYKGLLTDTVLTWKIRYQPVSVVYLSYDDGSFSCVNSNGKTLLTVKAI